MERRILLRGARQLLTLHGSSGPRRGAAMRELGIIPDGALLLRDGVIEAVGPSRRIENLADARDATEISADGKVVLPGFVDPRTQPFRGTPLLADYEASVSGNAEPGWQASADRQQALVQAARSATRSRMEMVARKALREFVRHGTTTVEAKSGLGLDDRTEIKILRALHALQGRPLDILLTYYGASAVPPEGEKTAAEYLDWITAKVLPKIRRLKLADFVEARCGPGAFSGEQARAYLSAARQAGFIPKVTSGEHSIDDGAGVAADLEAASVDHLEHVGESVIARLADSPTVAVLVPGAAFQRSRSRYAPARALIDAGVAVALASGYSADASGTCSMAAVMSLACNEMRMTPAEAVTAATINAAHAVRCAEQIGSLEFGKSADLIMMNVSDYREIPFRFGVNLVSLTMKRGDVVYPRMEFS